LSLQFGFFVVIGASILLLNCTGHSSADKGISHDNPKTAGRLPELLPATAAGVVKTHSLSAGTRIDVEASEAFDSDMDLEYGFLFGTVVDDVSGQDGQLAIPANSKALLAIRVNARQGNLTRVILGLNRIDAAGKFYRAGKGAKDLATLTFDEDSSRGPGHRSVHITGSTPLSFRLDGPIQVEQ